MGDQRGAASISMKIDAFVRFRGVDLNMAKKLRCWEMNRGIII